MTIQEWFDKRKEAQIERRAKEKNKKLKFSYNEQREYESIEGEIEALEEKIEGLEAELANPKNASDFMTLTKLSKEKEEAENLLLEKMDRYTYLDDLRATREFEVQVWEPALLV